jgi:rSAM/selenodomain-associated transferase 1
MRPAVILMLKAPRLGQVKTRLGSAVGEAAALGVYRQLAERQVAALPRGWQVAVHFAPADAAGEVRSWMEGRHPRLRFVAQAAGDLGRRLAAAVAAEFSRGAEGVLAIGGDCPYLDRAALMVAAVSLETCDVLLGPARDGGYYLVGLRQPQPALFSGIAWSTPAVLEQTRRIAHDSRLATVLLPMLEDVDDEESLARARARFPALAGAKALGAGSAAPAARRPPAP